jgi:dipeptidyl aminopeptidase/acylaminoacyl peptidase
MRKFLPLLLLPLGLFAQQKKTLDHTAYDEWRSIQNTQISNDGKYVAYGTKPNGYGNESVHLVQISGVPVLSSDRSSGHQFSNNSQHVFCKISNDFYADRELKRKKVKEEKMPKDTLGIYHLVSGKWDKIPGVKSFKVPEKWDNYVIYLYEPEKDTTKAAKKHKKRDKKNGYDLVIRDLRDGSEVIFNYVLDYQLAEEGAGLALVTTGNDSTVRKGVYRYDFAAKTFKPVFRAKGEYFQLKWDRLATAFTFMSDTDTTKAIQRDFHLHLWQSGSDSSVTLMSNKDLDNLNVNHEHANYFSESGKRLFFQVKELPVLQDTSLLDDEIVKVEVWNYTDEKLHTQQKIDKKDDVKFGYLSYYDVLNKKIVRLGSAQFTDVKVSDEGDGRTAIATNDRPYTHLVQWEGGPTQSDLYTLDLTTGKATKVEEKIRGSVNLSPKGKYAYWYEVEDSAWFAYSFAAQKTIRLTSNDKVVFYDELNDVPDYPSPYGLLGWSANDERVLIYDRYDIWEIDPLNPLGAERITPYGREDKITYRYIRLDPEERFISKNQVLSLRGFYETDKKESITSLMYGKGKPKKLFETNHHLDGFVKARNAQNVLFTKESFGVFPDLLATNTSFATPKKITDINPQQQDYNWGTAELFYWKSIDGEELEGMLIKPENFDPTKKYPLLVNFYERSSDDLHSHRAPSPGRSSINYSFYASRGYVIFNPNIHYKVGYPGQSAYNCVIPGVEALIKEGFVDEENIGVQGHSWGGYQIAYLIGKTDLFKCAEAGAPVPNMISAYGGIRWWTGLSRMFQYEHTQSRIGGTLWDKTDLYIENSPIFFVDKVNTPVLIMHNDADGHVPWYQGIEYIVALKRLNKPSWMLNYQGEPHWPVKLQNRIDFNIRLAQYFDYYLRDEPMPKWMRDGVSAIEMGINQGLELVEE